MKGCLIMKCSFWNGTECLYEGETCLHSPEQLELTPQAINADLLEACEAMIKISDLWLPVRALHPEHEGELKALCEAKRKLEAAIQKAKAE